MEKGEREGMTFQIKNRSRYRILYDMLTTANPSAKKTHMMYRSNLSFDQLAIYLNFLLQRGLVKKTQNEFNEWVYSITESGKKYVEKFDSLSSLVGSE